MILKVHGSRSRDADLLQKGFLKPIDISGIFGISLRKVYKLIQENRLKAIRLGRHIRIDKNDFQTFLKELKSGAQK